MLFSLSSLSSVTAAAVIAAATLTSASPISPSLEVRGITPNQGKCIAITPASLVEERNAIYSAKIVPDVYKSFNPQTTVALYYNKQFDPYGKKLTTTDTIPQPDVYFPKPYGDDDATTYTLIVNDPDVPANIANPTFLHWIRRGLKPSCNTPSTDSGTDVRFYVFPTPPPLLPPTEHRYVFSILREPKNGYSPSALKYLTQLVTFDINQYEKETGAKLIGSTYFLGSAT